MEGTVNSAFFNILIKEPLFFVRLISEKHFVGKIEHGVYVEDYEYEMIWQSTNPEIHFICSEEFINTNSEFALLVLDNQDYPLSSDKIEFSCHVANPQKDWVPIINSFLFRSQNKKDKFPFINLLWFLNHSNWNIQQLNNAIERYDSYTKNYICNGLKTFGRCLSRHKQLQIKETLKYFNYDYDVYSPSVVFEAFQNVKPQNTYGLKNWNLFNLVDYLFDKDYYMKFFLELFEREVDTNSLNKLIVVYEWLNTNDALDDYVILKSIYSLVSNKIQRCIILRYFHDIRIGNTKLDLDILNQFLNNDYEDFIRYRYCINTPCSEIYIGNKLLVDCILTLIKTNGETFQDFDGILDLAIKECNISNPKINLGIDDFLPCCNGGAVYNKDFIGFINYCIIFKLNEKKLTDEEILKYIRYILEKEGRKKKYYICAYDEKKEPLYVKSKCLINRHKFDCVVTNEYDDVWETATLDEKWLNFILGDSYNENCTEIKMSDISIVKIRKRIYDAFSKYKQEDGNYIVDGCEQNSFEIKMLFHFSILETMRVHPVKKSNVGYGIDIFGIRKVCMNTEEYKKEFYSEETDIVMNLVVSSLKRVLGEDSYNGEYFEIKYNENLLSELKRLYYFNNKGKMDNSDLNEKAYNFLRKKNMGRFPFFCAPKLSNVKNQAIGLPFYWCNGNECFRSVLANQFLKNMSSWHQYTLFHIAEILGYPKLEIRDGGIETDESISIFIILANKALRKFIQLKCKGCGHLMYPEKTDKFHSSHYYYCINSNCLKYMAHVYLNYCFNCKKGLIDSRESRQCPNGWYICPTCLSCCDDQQYERIIQKYVLSKRQIPNQIKAKYKMGHNNKGQYYCPKCGFQLEIKSSEAYCLQCNARYNLKLC